MDAKTKAGYKDKFLRYILAQERGCSGDNLFKDILKPDYPQGYSKKLIDEIDVYDGNLLEIYRGDVSYLLDKTDFTKPFLDSGGFVGEYNKHIEAARKLNEDTMRDSKVKELEEIDLKLNIRNSKYALPLSIISILIALGSLLYPVFLSKPEKGNDEQLKAIMERLDYLEGKWEKEKDSMRLQFDKFKDTIK